MKPKHTPGPWKLINTGENIFIGPDQFMTAAYIAKASGFDSQERDANARLIAVAPEMLHALKEVLVLIERDGSGGQTYDSYVYASGIAHKIDAIIVKAEGRGE